MPTTRTGENVSGNAEVESSGSTDKRDDGTFSADKIVLSERS
jgi:hypothetical protein